MKQLLEKEAKKILKLHLRKHSLDTYENIVPVDDIESSYYFYHEYSIVSSASINNYWLFTLGDQLYHELGHRMIGGPIRWYVHKSNGHCFMSIYKDSIFIYEEWVLKYKLYNSKIFYLSLDNYKIEQNFEKAISLWQLSNILDEYLFLSLLKISINERVYKIGFLRNYELLKKNRKLENQELIEELLAQMSYLNRRLDDKLSWNITKKILELDDIRKLELHEKQLKKRPEMERKKNLE